MVYSIQEDALSSPGYEISGTVNAIILLCMYTRTVRYTDILKISVLNQYRYIDTRYSTIPIYRHFGYTGIFRYRPLAHDVIAPVTMHLEDKLAIYA
jgi:hypothetical protein